MRLNVLKSNKGYSMIDGKIQAVEITRIYQMVDSESKDVSYSILCRIGGKDKTLGLGKLPSLFNTETGCINNSESDKVGVIDGAYYDIEDVIGDKGTNEIYYWDEDSIKCISTSMLDITLTPSTDSRGNFRWEVKTFSYSSKVYSSEELAKADHSFEVIEYDGSTHIHPSLLSSVKLTDAQQEIFGNLIKALDACEDAKIGIAFHVWDNAISAYNKDNDLCLECNYESEHDNACAIDELLPQEQHRISVPVRSLGDEDSIWASHE